MVISLIVISLVLQIIYGIGSLGELFLLRMLGAVDDAVALNKEKSWVKTNRLIINQIVNRSPITYKVKQGK